MTPHPKIRKTVKWAGAAVTVLLVVVWIGSGWWGLQWRSASGYITWVGAGCYCLNWFPPDQRKAQYYGWDCTTYPYEFHWWGHWLSTSQYLFFAVPLWIPTLAFALLTAAAWRLDTLARRRAKLNLCPTGGCNYDRTGLAAGAVCPECGKLPA